MQGDRREAEKIQKSSREREIEERHKMYSR
jgi:hypothetical protein